ncbi:MAG: PTS sorbitol transporter [Acidimicrobiia bacterium]|nr:PTS sorbitol transporter [Acidimicrobiia bacterium]
MAFFDKFKKKDREEPEVGVEEEVVSSDGEESTVPVEEPTETPNVEPPPEGSYRAVRIEQGAKGWGGPLTVKPEPGKDLIYSVTGGGIHPLAQHIADLTGGRAFDGFSSSAPFEDIAVAVIDCGGTARIGVYPMKGVLTVDIHGTSPSGPLARFITEENFVSGVKPENVSPAEE